MTKEELIHQRQNERKSIDERESRFDHLSPHFTFSSSPYLQPLTLSSFLPSNIPIFLTQPIPCPFSPFLIYVFILFAFAIFLLRPPNQSSSSFPLSPRLSLSYPSLSSHPTCSHTCIPPHFWEGQNTEIKKRNVIHKILPGCYSRRGRREDQVA